MLSGNNRDDEGHHWSNDHNRWFSSYSLCICFHIYLFRNHWSNDHNRWFSSYSLCICFYIYLFRNHLHNAVQQIRYYQLPI